MTFYQKNKIFTTISQLQVITATIVIYLSHVQWRNCDTHDPSIINVFLNYIKAFLMIWGTITLLMRTKTRKEKWTKLPPPKKCYLLLISV